MTAPNSIGPQHAKAAEHHDPRGILVFDHLPPDLQNAEDSTLASDRERLLELNEHRGARLISYLRPATAAERTLLEHLGYELPAKLMTGVSWTTAGVRFRGWPQLNTFGPRQQAGRIDALDASWDAGYPEVIRSAAVIDVPTTEQEN